VPYLARVYESGDAQALLLPEDFQFDASQVEVTQDGEAVILRPHAENSEPWASLKEAIRLGGFSDDFLAAGREQPEMPEDRDFKGIFP
jgi:antitoxin VapB